ARRPKQRVRGVRAEAEFGRVGLSDDDRAGGADTLDMDRVRVRHEVGEDTGAPGAWQPLGLREILDGCRQAVQPAARAAALQLVVGGVRLLHEFGTRPQADDRVDLWIERLDPAEIRLHYRRASQAALMDGARKLRRAQQGRIAAHVVLAMLVTNKCRGRCRAECSSAPCPSYYAAVRPQRRSPSAA